MADVNAKIGVQIDTSAALAELKALQRQLANFHSSVAKGSAASAAAQKNLQHNLLNAINSTGKFYAQMGLVRTSTESFTHALEKNKLSMREYFRYAGGASKTFGRLFKQEFDTIGRVAEERVKKMQTQYIKMGRDASGAMKAMAITPTTLNMKDYGTQVALAAQRQALFNQLLKQGSTNLLNFGKNTQWAGRQLMVGFTIPLTYFGTAAAKTFMDLEKQAIKFRRVYGDIFTTTEETDKALADIQKLASEFTKYGVAVADTMEMAASAAAMGKTGAELTAQVAEATRLAVLGGVEQAQALETTISVTNAFGIAADDLRKKIDFLNAVENQTVVSIEDLTVAIPKAGPVVKQLGGSVEDLAFFLTAMKEGGINASEGANALKSGLASLINPTDKAADMLSKMGINIKAIVEGNAGNLKEIVIDFAQSLDTLDPLNRARAIEQLFGKFQFARLSTLFQNVTKEGTQASRVLDLAGASIEELAILSERELKKVEDAVGVNFKEAVEQLKIAIAPIGKVFLETVTPLLKSLGKLFEKFDGLSEGAQKFIVVTGTLVGAVGPVLLMTFGLISNAIANIVKLFVTMRSGFLKAGSSSKVLAEQTQYLNSEQIEAATVAASLNQAHNRLTQSFNAETTAVKLLRQAYVDATAAAAIFAARNPGMMSPAFRGIKGGGTQKFAEGTPEVVGGVPGKDSVPSLLMPGEAVVPAKIAQDNRYKPIIEALVSGDIRRYGTGTPEVKKKKSFAHAVDTKVMRDSSYEAQLLGAKEEKAYRSVGFDIDKEMNEKLRNKISTVKVSEYLSQIKDDRSLETMSKSLMKNGYTAQESVTVAREIRNRLVKSLSSLDKNALINDDFIYRRMGNARTGIIGGLLRDRQNPLFARGVNKLYNELVKRSTGALTPKNYTQKVPVQELISQMERDGSADKKTINKLKEIAAADPKYRIDANKDINGRIIEYSRKEYDSNKREFSSKKNVGVLDPRTGRFRTGRVSGSSGRSQVIKSKVLDKRFLEAIGAPVRVMAADNEFVLDKKGATPVNKVPGARKKRANEVPVPNNRMDRNVLTLKPGQTIARIAGLRGSGLRYMPGLVDSPTVVPAGLKGGSGTPGVPISDVGKNYTRTQKELISKIEKQTSAVEETTKATKTIGQKFTAGANVFTGLTIAGSLLGGKIGEVSSKLVPLAIGLSTVTMLLGPMKAGLTRFGVFLATNPFAPLIVAITALVAGHKIIEARNAKMAKAQSEYIDSISATTEKMKKVGEVTGKVGASEIMQRRREGGTSDKFITGFNRAGQQFGTSFLESDIGKNIYENFAKNFATAGQQSVKQIALELSAYVSDGLISAEQANSIARAIGINMSDMTISADINAQLRSIIGPSGEDLVKDPLKVRLEIISEQQDMFNDIGKELRKTYTEGLGAISSTKKQRELASAVGAAAGQSLETIQAQRDAQANMYDNKIRELETEKLKTKDLEKQKNIEKEISYLKFQQKQDDEKLAGQRSKLLKDQQSYYDTIKAAEFFSLDRPGEVALFRGAQEQVRTKYKGTGQEALVEAFISAAKDTKSKEAELTLTTLVGSGDLTPSAGIRLLNMFKDDQAKLEVILNSKVALENPDKFAQLTNIAGSLKGKGKKAIGIELVASLTAEGEEGKLDDRLSALTMLQQMDGKEINLTTFLKGNAVGKLDELVPLLNEVEKLKGPITKDVFVQLKKTEGMPDFSAIKADWEYYSNLPSEIQKTAIETYIAIYKTIGTREKEEFARNKAGANSGTVYDYWMSQSESVITNELNKKMFPELKPENKIPTGPGNVDTKGKDSPFYDLLTDLKRFRDSTIDAAGGAKELMRILGQNKDITIFKGLDQRLSSLAANSDFIDFIGGMEKAIQDKLINVSKKGVVSLTDLGEATKKAYDERQLGIYQVEQAKVIQGAMAQRGAFIKLRAAGLSSAEALELIADQQLAISINSQKSAKEIKRFVESIKEAKQEIDKTTMETDPLGWFNQNMDKAFKTFDLQERAARAKYRSEIDRINKLIDSAEDKVETLRRKAEMEYDRPIQALQDESRALNNDLTIMSQATDKINEKYDKQRDALESIYSINERIAQQQKSKITLADALTQGDIAAAAQAAQELRNQSQEFAQQDSLDALEKARQNEIDSLRSASGLSRVQIETRLYEIGQQIYNLETQRQAIDAEILKLQDEIYNLKEGQLRATQDALQAELDAIEAQRQKWEDTQLALELAKAEAAGYKNELLLAEEVLKRMVALLKSLGAGMFGGGGGGVLGGGTGATGAAAAAGYTDIAAYQDWRRGERAMYGGMIKKYDVGGIVAGSGMTDKVPALLTPGEYVINKAATQKFGPLLEELNESKYPGSLSLGGSPVVAGVSNNMINNNSTSVYNYSLTVDVAGSSASPDDIARTVIAQIRNMDAQRLRGNKY